MKVLLIFIFLTAPIMSAELSLENQFQARQIIAHKCWKCHGSERDEGDIRLHTRKHIINSGTVDLKSPMNSALIKRITLPEGHKEIMPQESPPLSKEEIATLTTWVKDGLKWDGRGAFKEAPLALREVKPIQDSAFTHPTDQHVDAYFKSKGQKWQPLVDDKTFLRRAYFDTIGLLPTPAETKTFLEDKSQDKRKVLVQKLLSRNLDYEVEWLSFWNDLLRNDYSGTGYITGGRKAITKWIRKSLKANKPYNVMVKELFSENTESYGFIRGIQWRGTVSASQTVEMQAAQNSAQAFLGINIKCASCHDSFTSNWSLQQSHQFASAFSKIGSIDIHRCDKPTGKKATPGFLYSELGQITEKAPLPKRLQEIGNMLTSPKNGRFARTIVNRYWSKLMGRGLIFQVDEMDSAPWSQDVLDDLAFRFTKNNYDLKWLITEILTSRAYQLPSTQTSSRHDLAKSSYIFTGPIVRRLTAEQFSDAFSSSISPIYTAKDGKTVTRAAEMTRDAFQTALGRPTRENVTSARPERGNLLESLELTNGTVLDNSLKKAAEKAKIEHGANVENYLKELFAKGLQRQPTDKELTLLSSIYKDSPNAQAYHDILWIFINLPEFQSIL